MLCAETDELNISAGINWFSCLNDWLSHFTTDENLFIVSLRISLYRTKPKGSKGEKNDGNKETKRYAGQKYTKPSSPITDYKLLYKLSPILYTSFTVIVQQLYNRCSLRYECCSECSLNVHSEM